MEGDGNSRMWHVCCMGLKPQETTSGNLSYAAPLVLLHSKIRIISVCVCVYWGERLHHRYLGRRSRRAVTPLSTVDIALTVPLPLSPENVNWDSK